MKPKAKTLIEKLGFTDPDRKFSKHDEIQLWVYSNVETILKSLSSGDKSFDIKAKTLEYPIIQNSLNHKAVVGFIDLYVSGHVRSTDGLTDNRFDASLEVKTKIQCCGDLIRQIQFYRQYQPRESIWIVVSPDDRFHNVLREHRIYFFKALSL